MRASQENRQAQFRSLLTGDDELLLVDMIAHESVSGLFEYQLIVVSENADIDLYSILGTAAHVELELTRGGTRYYHGHVCEFAFAGYRDNFAEYRLTLRPWLWFLTRASDNRIFQNQTVKEIIEEVCDEHGFTDLEFRLDDQAYSQREFCVQYRESDFDFVSRLMEQEGIYYFFEHEETKHTLIVADATTNGDIFENYDCIPWHEPGEDQQADRDYLEDWSMTRGVRSGAVSLSDYNFETPNLDLRAVSRSDKSHTNAHFARYEYPGDYKTADQGQDVSVIRRQERQADHEIYAGSGNARGLVPGFVFTLEGARRQDQNQEYLILAVSHRIHQGGYDSGGVNTGDQFNYGCSVEAMPSSFPFRPPRTTPRPRMHGPQTAVVVGDSGKEIWTDEYGRIKVQFHWDCDGNNDQNSSCWVRVSQAWAGKQWGAQFIPRIGHEVIVDFLEGDPDRPIVTGCVYNANNMPPYALPANQTQSGIKTRSSESGNQNNFNELRFEDKKGAEQVYLHAEKDMQTEIENNDVINVGNDRTETVKGNETVTIDKDRTHTVKKNENLTVNLDSTHKVDKNRSLTVGVNETRTINANSSETITGTWTNTTTGGITITSPAAININSATGIFLNCTKFSVADADKVTFGSVTLNFQGSANNVVGQTLDVRAVSMAAYLTNFQINGLNMGTNVTDITGNMISVKQTNISTKDVKIDVKKNMIKLKKGIMEVGNKAIDIAKDTFKIQG